MNFKEYDEIIENHKNNYKQEIINFINENDLNDVFTVENTFFDDYKVNLYVYIRVSTEKQEFGRQIIELYKWAKSKNIKICIDFIFCDKYTGKRTTREQYEKMHDSLQESDYLIVSELNRLGRNWDNTKKEWQFLTDKNINTIILDNAMLSAKLPNEKQEAITLEYKFVRDIVFNAINYVASKKIQEVSMSTKAGLEKAKMQGKQLGKPRSKYSTKENFIKTLEYMINNKVGQNKATIICRYPKDTFQKDIKKCYDKYNTKNYQEILNKIKEDTTKWEQF